MRISATGSDGRSARRARGFTLVELLVVLALLGVVGAAVALSIPPARSNAEIEALRLAARLTRASERAIVTGRPLGLEIDRSGYRFSAYVDRGWYPARDEALGAHGFSGALRIEIDADGLASAGPRRQGRRRDAQESAELTLVGPALRFEPTGEGPALRIMIVGERDAWRVETDGVGGAEARRVSS